MENLGNSAVCCFKIPGIAQFDLDSDLAQVVIGVRRSGKSMLCLKVLKESGKNFGYVDFDDEELVDLTKLKNQRKYMPGGRTIQPCGEIRLWI